MKGYILYADYETKDEETYLYFFGRLENGQSFAISKKFEPYLYIRKIDEKKCHFFKCDKAETKMKNFNNEEVIKISFKNIKDLNLFYKANYNNVEIYEADIRPHYRFLIDNDILCTVEIEGEYQSSEKVDRFYVEPKISSTYFKPKLKFISIDTESDKKGNLFSISIYTENYKKIFMVTRHNLKHVIQCETEEECLKKFKEEIIKLDPDIITGWNIITFDFVLLKQLFEKYKISFDIGRTNKEPHIKLEKNFFKSSVIDLPGRQVLDGINLIKDPFIKDSPFIRNSNFDSYSLEDVSQEILKKGKLIKGSKRHEEIENLYKKNSSESHQKLADYNLLDAQLVYEIIERTKIIDLAIERTQLTGMLIDRMTASVASFDPLYIREAIKRKIVSPTTKYYQKEARIKGGYVSSLSPGIYKNVVVLDFKSLYPSIIRTFNIDPASFIKKKEKKYIEAPNGALFKNSDGILPIIIEKLHQEREKAKKEKRDLLSHTIKIIMNSFYGVLASPTSRYFNPQIANAITHFGQFIIKLTAQEIEKKGYKVIYSDTDSVFVETKLEKDKADLLGKKLESEINNFYESYIKENYSRKSFLEIQFQKQYFSMMIPQIRSKEHSGLAAKKRYAGLIEKNGKEEIEIVGLEAIRGDWTEAAHEFQIQLLEKVFHEEEVGSYIKNYIKKIREGKMNDKLIYRKSIRKELDEYTKTTPPHVKAARQLDSLESTVIEYYITVAGPEPIQKLKHKIDYEHYIEKQLKPIAEQILIFTNKKFEDFSDKSKQTKLF